MDGTEIADSDAESDEFEHGGVPGAGCGDKNADHDPARMLDDIDFDKFVSLYSSVERRRIQTQTEDSSRDVVAAMVNGSSQVASFREATHGQKRGSDAEMRAGVETLDGSAELGGCRNPPGEMPKSTTRKRRHTGDIVSGSAELNPSTEPEKLSRKNKRSKTYGSSKTRLIDDENHVSTEVAVADATPRRPIGEREHDASPELATRGDTHPLTSMKKPAQWSGQMYGNSNLLAPTISTTKSSLGAYQSISIDLRGTSSGLDFDGNPFGTVSQVSIGDDEDATRIKSFFEQQRGHFNDIGDGSEELIAPQGGHCDEIASAIDPSVLVRSPAPPNDTQLLSSSSILKSTCTERSRSTAQHSDPLPEDDSAIGLPLPKQEEPRTGKKRGGKRKSEQTLPSSSQPDEATIEKLDEAKLEIGLPKELYKPRQSRSRRSTSIIDAEIHSSQNDTEQLPDVKQPNTQAKTSPAKNPSSDLHLSDEALIGLPKESYIPRPSRSRSKRAVNENETSVNDTETRDARQDIEASQQNATPAPDSTSKGRKGKKAKEKRAKTSLAKKSEPMLGEGEDEVVWMESKPAKVDIGKLQDVSPTKSDAKFEGNPVDIDQVISEEKANPLMSKKNEFSPRDGEDGPEDEDEEDIIKPIKRTTIKKPLITVEIPIPHAHSSKARTEPEEKEEVTAPRAAAPGPKKRGRKRKKPIEPEPHPEEAEITQSKANDETISSHNDKKTSERPPLQEKPVNTSLPPPSVSSTRTPSPSKHHPPASPHSPLKAILLSPVPSIASSTDKHHQHQPSGGLSRYRVGLSRRAPIPSLLKIVRKDEPAPVVERRGKKKKGSGKGDDGKAEETQKLGAREGASGDAGLDGDGDGDEESGTKRGVNELLMMEEEYYSP